MMSKIVKIVKPSKSAMQSKRKENQWVIKFPHDDSRFIDPIMGWVGTRDMQQEVKLRFSSLEKAIDFCHKRNWQYEVEPEHRLQVKPKSYADTITRRVTNV